MRIDKLLANMGYGTRKDVKKLLKTGCVTVDDEIVKDGATHVKPNEQAIYVNGEKVEYKPYIYLMLNKPKGVISATEDDVHKTVIDLLSDDYKKYQPFPVGRLDKNTTGMLIITNDGNLNHELMSPRKHVPKTYFAIIDGVVTADDVQKFHEGVTLDDGYVTKPAELTILKSAEKSEIELTITEGKFHQVKRMFQAVGKKVLELKRIQIGELPLDESLQEGQYKELTPIQIEMLKMR